MWLLYSYAGGSALASKLLQVYFTLFKMLLAGRIGYAAEADKKRQDKAAAKGLDKKKRKGGGNKRAAKKDVPADNAAPSGQDAGPVQVRGGASCGCCNMCRSWIVMVNAAVPSGDGHGWADALCHPDGCAPCLSLRAC